jgi:hypothetical protein
VIYVCEPLCLWRFVKARELDRRMMRVAERLLRKATPSEAKVGAFFSKMGLKGAKSGYERPDT